jgi:hypothetical protein
VLYGLAIDWRFTTRTTILNWFLIEEIVAMAMLCFAGRFV